MRHSIGTLRKEALHALKLSRVERRLVKKFKDEQNVSVEAFVEAVVRIEPLDTTDMARVGAIVLGFDNEELRIEIMEMCSRAEVVYRDDRDKLIRPVPAAIPMI